VNTWSLISALISIICRNAAPLDALGRAAGASISHFVIDKLATFINMYFLSIFME